MPKRKSILNFIALYSLSTQVAQLLTLCAALLSRRFLGPTQTGIWTALQVLVDYSKYSTLGIMDAVSREIPYKIGKGENDSAEKIKNLAASFVLSGSVLISAAILCFAVFSRRHFTSEITAGLYLIAAVIFLQRLNNLQVALLRCYKQFHIEAGFTMASAAVNAVLVAFLAYHFKIFGFMWAMILSLLFNILFVRIRYHFNFSWNYDLKALKPLVSRGFPLMILGLGITFFRSLDRVFIAQFLGFEALGLYSIALMVVSYTSNFPIAIGIVLLPHFQEKFGQNDNPGDLTHSLQKSAQGFALFMPVLIAFVILAAPYGILFFLPKFASGLTALKLLLPSMFVTAIAQLYYDTLITIRKQRVLFPILGASALMTAAFDYLAIKAGGGIEGVAAATTAGFTIYFILVQATGSFFFSCRLFLNKTLITTIFCFFYLCLFVFLSLRLETTLTLQSLTRDLLIFILYALPLIVLLNLKFSLFDKIWNRLQGKKNLP